MADQTSRPQSHSEYRSAQDASSEVVSSRRGPLSGVKVLDFSTLLPGPYATALLADLGAEVTHVESPTRPDLTRALPPFIEGRSAAHLSLNRGKRSVAINLKREAGLKLALKLVEQSDIVVEQFRPGVMARLGLDYQTLSRLNPKLIYCSITGYGQHGPLAMRAGHDINYLALGGVASYSGRQGEGPRLSGTQIADIAGGSYPAVIAILAALFERQQTECGRHLDISMSDGALALNALTLSPTMASQEDPDFGREWLNGGTLYDYYQTSDGRHLAIGALEPQFVAQLLEALELTSFVKDALRPPGQQAEIKAQISVVIKSQPLEHWREVFAGLDCCCEPVLTLTEAAQHPHFVARGAIERRAVTQTSSADRVNPDEMKSVTDSDPQMLAISTPLGATFPSCAAHLGVPLGTHTDEVLDMLGVTPEERQQLRADRVIK